MKTSHWILFTLSFITFINCSQPTQQKDQLFIDTTVTGLRKATVYLHENVNGEIIPVDSLQVEDTEHFVFTRNITHPDLFWVQIKNRVPMAIFVEPGVPIYVKTHMDSLHTYKTVGSKTQQDLATFLGYMGNRDESYRIYSRNYALANKNQDEYGAKQSLAKMKSNRESKTMIALNYAVKNKNTQLSPFIALNYLPNTLQQRWYDSIYLNLSDSIKNTYFGKELGAYIKGVESTKIGGSVSPIKITDLEGKSYTIPSKDKETILYFWRTKNLQSRTDALLLNKIDPLLLSKTNIFTVNLDTDSVKLKKLSEFNDATLPIIFNEKGIKSEIAQRFALRKVPGSVTIGTDGKIKALGMGALEVESYLKNASN